MKKPDLPSPDPTGPLSERGQAIFDGALQLPSNQRAAYVEQACADDTTLCRQVKGLLGAHEKAGGFLDPGAIPSETVVLRIGS